jgi:hypothetical protein
MQNEWNERLDKQIGCDFYNYSMKDRRIDNKARGAQNWVYLKETKKAKEYANLS